ncbi:thioredoxin domain-containing protein [Acrocarpospora sp. B8E8]|uniref:thioredoxin family protein n=1 Tax=Acrocarpospora sp. B8E8 TaxID=3153572 RepID=UPI00325F7383
MGKLRGTGIDRTVRFPDECLPGVIRYLILDDLPADQLSGEFDPIGTVDVPGHVEITYVADGPARLAEVPDMDGLDLDNVRDEDLRIVARMEGLRDLSLSGDFTDDGLVALRSLRRLETLNLRSDRMTGDIAFPDSPLLTVRLRGRALSDQVFWRVAELPLAVLAVTGDGITGSGLGALVTPPDLGYLRLGGLRLDPGQLRRLGRTRSLRVLSLAGAVDADAVLSLAPPLCEIDLDRVPRAACARFLFAGLAVNGLYAAPEHADAYARMLADYDPGPLTAPQRPLITQPHELHALLGGPAPVLVDFSAPDSLACERLRPVIDRILAEYRGELAGAAIDIEQSPSAAQYFGVESVPTVLLLNGGQELLRLTGSPSPTDVIQRVTAVLQKESVSV